MTTSRWARQYDPFGSKERSRRRALEAEFDEFEADLREVKQQQAAGDERAARALELLLKPKSYEAEAVMSALRDGTAFPKRRYVTKGQRLREEIMRRMEAGALLYWVEDSPERRRQLVGETMPGSAPQLQPKPLPTRRRCAAKGCTVRFKITRQNRRYCSKRCRDASRVRKKAVPPKERSCSACGGPFLAKTTRAKYCSDRCRVRAHLRAIGYDSNSW